METWKCILLTLDSGDSVLYRQGDKNLLIDCGTRSKGDTVVKYIKDLGITKLDYLIGTHPHDDHMGGMTKVIQNFDIGLLYMPDTTNNNITTSWYIELLNTIDEKKVEWKYPTVGEIIKFGDADIQILAPNSKEYDDLNNYSIVTMITYGQVSILSMGDAENLSENEILNNGMDVEAQILKVGHHGSNSSTSKTFLKAVNPQFAIISAKIGNTYNHPTKSVMNLLKENNISVYRTDESGTIIMTTNGKEIKFNKEPGDYLSGSELT